MKKRILSALLALVMVLALLPATAFAVEYADPGSADPDDVSYDTVSGGVTTTHHFYEVVNGRVSTVNVQYCAASDANTKRVAGNWYWLDNKNDPNAPKYYAVTSGLIVGTGTSGNWYPDPAAFINSSDRLVSNSFTLLANATLTAPTNPKNWPTSLTVDVNGHQLDLGSLLTSGELAGNFNSLTITDRLNPLTNTYTGSVSAIAKDTSARTSPAPSGTSYSNLNLTISNVTVPSIDLKGGANTVTLNNVTVTGTIKMDGTTTTTTTSTGKSSTVYSAQRLNINNNGTSNLSTHTKVGGDITVVGDGSTLIMNNLTNTGTQIATTVTGNGGSVTVNGATNIGDITVESRSGATATPPSVTVNGGVVGNIVRNANDSTQANTVSIGSAATAYRVNTPNGRVTVNQGRVKTDVIVGAGSLTLTGPVTIGMDSPNGTVQLPGTGATTLSITGTGSKIAGITASGKNLKISSWPTGRENNFGVLDLGSHAERGVKGGTFTDDTNLKDPTKALWFDTNLQYVVDMQNGTFSLYGKTEMARAISDISSSVAAGSGAPPTVNMNILCNEGTYKLVLKNAGITWAQIGYDEAIGMILPELINGYDVATWTSGDNTSSVPSGKEQIIPKPSNGDTFTLHANGVATTVAKSITAVAVSNGNGTVENQNVRVAMNGTNIQLSGAVTPAPGSNIATIELDLTTDALETTNGGTTAGGGSVSNSAAYKVLRNVQVFYNVDTKAVGFNTLQKIDGGAIVNEKGELVLNNGTGTHYTISANLSQSASNLGIYTAGKEVQAIVSGSLANRTQSDKDQIIAQIAGAGAEFDINGNRAILEAINAAQATFTSTNSVSSMVTNAQNYIWRNGNSFKNATTGQPNNLGKGDSSIKPHTGNLSTTGTFGADGIKIQSLYAKAYIVPYLVVNATGMNQNGTFNATLTVNYRVDVSADPYNPNEYYTVQTGRALSALTGDMATKPVLVKFANAFPISSAYMHQDGKYVYEKAGGYEATAGTDYDGWAINHAGSNGNGLGSIVLNSTVGPISMTSDIALRAPALVDGVTYDDLQAAIDDTVPGVISTTDTTVSSETMDKITIGGAYGPTDCVVTMNGIARKIALVSSGNRKITSNTNNVEVQSQNGINYIIQLKRDNVAAGTVAIGVVGTAGGTASLSASTAKAGQTVTVTVVPNAGQSAKGVTVKTNTGSTINATSTGVANQYSFTVPTGVTSITVTPNFGVAGQAIVSVNNNNNGSATVAGNAGTVPQGSTVTVYTTPKAGYRATSVSVRFSNGTTVNATSTGTNTWTFTVPANATTVTITPNFSVDTGLPFLDVPSTEYYLPYVRFVYNHGMMKGDGNDYTFNGNGQITRGQIVTILYRLQNSPSVALNTSFRDVPANEYYAYPVAWAAANGIVNGRSSSSFDPNAAITRQELAAILYRYNTFRGLSSGNLSNLSQFTDRGYVDNYAQTPMQWAVGNGIITGTSTNTLSPNGTATRYQAATMLTRYCQTFLKMV